jgi:hypothetical protein
MTTTHRAEMFRVEPFERRLELGEAARELVLKPLLQLTVVERCSRG